MHHLACEICKQAIKERPSWVLGVSELRLVRADSAVACRGASAPGVEVGEASRHLSAIHQHSSSPGYTSDRVERFLSLRTLNIPSARKNEDMLQSGVEKVGWQRCREAKPHGTLINMGTWGWTTFPSVCHPRLECRVCLLQEGMDKVPVGMLSRVMTWIGCSVPTP